MKIPDLYDTCSIPRGVVHDKVEHLPFLDEELKLIQYAEEISFSTVNNVLA